MMNIYERTLTGLEMAQGGRGWVKLQRLLMLRRVANCKSAVIVSRHEWHRDVENWRIEFDASKWTGRP